MAQRRMFSKDISGSDAFLEMPISSQLLYFHLGMEADDDGFIGSPKKVSRMLGCGEDDLRVLASKRFILVFPSGVVVIKHWKVNNYIQSDRYKETRYLEEKRALVTKENGAYTECIQNSNKMETQVRLGKVRLGYTATNVADPPKKPIKKLDSPMDLNGFIGWCRKSPQRHINLIGEYADTIRPGFSTRLQWEGFMRRNLRPAKELAPYTDDQISRAMRQIQKAQGDGWLKKYTLETLTKFLS